MRNLRTLRRACLVILLPGVASCAATDPLYRSGLWRPNGSNELNLRVMVVEQGDVTRGRGEPGSDGAEAAAAIQRLRAGKVKDIAVQNSQTISSGGS